MALQKKEKANAKRAKQASRWTSDNTVGRALDTPTARRMANTLATSNVPIVGTGIRKAGLAIGNYRDSTVSATQEKLKERRDSSCISLSRSKN